jgi:hypothetical protein
MKKLLSILFLSTVLFLNTGFGAIENSTYVQTELSVKAVSNVHKVGEISIDKIVVEEAVSAKSISEKVGSCIIGSVSLFVRSMIDFILTFLK